MGEEGRVLARAETERLHCLREAVTPALHRSSITHVGGDEERVRNGLGQGRSHRSEQDRVGGRYRLEGRGNGRIHASRTRPSFLAWLTGKLMMSATKAGITQGTLLVEEDAKNPLSFVKKPLWWPHLST